VQARTGDRFRQLYDAGSLDAHDGAHSRADLALCGMLAFWTNGELRREGRKNRKTRVTPSEAAKPLATPVRSAANTL
jgi:primase-polymerase (primpol)-like protein